MSMYTRLHRFDTLMIIKNIIKIFNILIFLLITFIIKKNL